jgi:methylenetetrahydrofolate--tRNA-(uracil-5-)-methyltransferase
MNVNFGLFPPVEVTRQPGVRLSGLQRGRAKKRAITSRALADLDRWLAAPAASGAAEAAE